MVRGETSLTLSPQGRWADQIEALLAAPAAPVESVHVRTKTRYIRHTKPPKAPRPPKPCGYCGVMMQGGPRKYCTDSHRVMAFKVRAKATAPK